MPYINRERRRELFGPSSHDLPKTPGELNFIITSLINEYILTTGMNYAHCNDVIGALEGAKMEFYRRVVAPYEDDKIQQNGDVYHRCLVT